MYFIGSISFAVAFLRAQPHLTAGDRGECATVYVDIYDQIYAEAECNANKFAIAEALQYKCPKGKYTQNPQGLRLTAQ